MHPRTARRLQWPALVVWLLSSCANPTRHEAPASTKPPISPAVAPAPAPVPAPDPAALASALAHKFIIVDGHVDLPYRLHGGREGGKLTEDASQRTDTGDFDYPRARAGGLDAPFMSIYVPAKYEATGGAKALADQLIDTVEALAKQHPKKFALAATPTAVRANFATRTISLPMGIENGSALERNLANVRHFRERGVSYITLTHSKDNAICDSSYDTAHTHGGLSAFGKQVVTEMNNVGIMVDVSHVSDDSFFQAIELSQVPVIASHSSLRHFVPDFSRNVSDEMLKALAKKGGVIMINFGSTFLLPKPNEVGTARWKMGAAFEAKKGLNHEKKADRKTIDAHVNAKLPMVYATVNDVADHIDRVKAQVGVDHIGLGSDFDGVGDSLPTGLKDASEYPHLLKVLLERGYTEEEIEKICSGNVMRVWQQVLDHADQAKAARSQE